MTKSFWINFRLTKLRLAALLGLAALLTGPQAQADVLLSEEFRYSDGQLIGNDGGFSLDASNRWGGAWQNAVWQPTSRPASWRISGNQFETNTTFGAIPGLNMGVERLIQENKLPTPTTSGSTSSTGTTPVRSMFPVFLASGSMTGTSVVRNSLH